MRRIIELPKEDIDFLDSLNLNWETITERGINYLIIYNLSIPKGYNNSFVVVSFKIPSGYPDSQIDMAYFFPELKRIDEIPIKQITFITIDGKRYQRWSRHRLSQNAWIPGSDNICTHLTWVKEWLENELKRN